MKRILFIASLVISANTVWAANQAQFDCHLVDEFDDWSVKVDLERQQVEFFDNDHWSTLSLVGSPISGHYRFFGYDSMSSRSSGNDQITFDFNQSTLSGTLTDGVGAESKSYAFICG